MKISAGRKSDVAMDNCPYYITTQCALILMMIPAISARMCQPGQMQTKDSPLFRRRVEGFGSLDEAVLFKPLDHIVSLSFADPCRRSDPWHGGQAVIAAQRMRHIK